MLALAGCATGAPATGGPGPSASGSPESTPTATAEPTQLDPADFATQLADRRGDGVDFDSLDGNVHCGIWSAMTYNPLEGDPLEGVSYAGCRPAEADYETEPSSMFDAVGCRGGEIVGDLAVGPVCSNGQMFTGEAPADRPVGVIRPGESLGFAGITCTSPDASSIECVRASDGAGFLVGRADYRYF